MIGIIGYGMVGKAVDHGFSKTTSIIVDPQHTSTTIEQMAASQPEAVFVCVPTDDEDFILIQQVLNRLRRCYKGLVIIKSTVPSMYIGNYNAVFNPEFLSRKTSLTDFVDPPVVVFGGDEELCKQAVEIYNKYSVVDMSNTHIVDLATATLIKYTLNSFYALKVTFMNEVYDAAQYFGADYDKLANIISTHPWVGNQHLQVPGPDGQRGFGGPCLPKDTRAFAKHYRSKLLPVALKLNKQIRGNNGN